MRFQGDHTPERWGSKIFLGRYRFRSVWTNVKHTSDDGDSVGPVQEAHLIDAADTRDLDRRTWRRRQVQQIQTLVSAKQQVL